MSDGDGKDGNCAKFFEYLFHCWCHNPFATFPLCLLAHAYHVAFQLVKKVLSLDLTVVLPVYMDKPFCKNIDINQEATGGEYLLGGY